MWFEMVIVPKNYICNKMASNNDYSKSVVIITESFLNFALIAIFINALITRKCRSHQFLWTEVVEKMLKTQMTVHEIFQNC